MAKTYSGGIGIATGFKLSDPQPIADYMVVDLISDLTNTTILPNQFIGMFTFVKEDDKLYTKTSTGWSPVSIDESNLVHKTGPESIGGIKTFTATPIAPGYSIPLGTNQQVLLADGTIADYNTIVAGGQLAQFTWKYVTNTTAADPGSGFFRFNNATISSVTQIYIDDLTSNNQIDISELFGAVAGDWLILVQQRSDASKWAQFKTSTAYTDNVGWWTLPVTFVQAGSGGPITSSTDCIFVFINKNNTTNVVPNSRTITINGVTQDLSVNRNWRTAQSASGVYSFGGATAASPTQVSVGAITGIIVNNESVLGTSTFTDVSFPTTSNITVPTLGSGISSHVLLNSSNTLVFQNTFPTPQQRRQNIYLFKIGHPAGTITTVINEPDFAIAPLSQFRDWMQALNYINQGVYPYPNGTNLQLNLTAGEIVGDGINYVNNIYAPNNLTVPAAVPMSWLYRTQTGSGGGVVNTITPGFYDVTGTITAIAGSSNQATLQYIYYVPGANLSIVQYGQTIYSTLSNAVAAVGKESRVVYPSLVRSAILMAVLAITKGCTNLSDTNTAQIFRADIFGQSGGSTAGVSTGTLQSVYNNSVEPEIITNSTLGAVSIRRGSAADTDNVLEVQNGAGTTTYNINGNGNVAIGSSTAATSRLEITGTSTSDGGQLGSELLTTASSGAGTDWTGSSFTSGYTHVTGNTTVLNTTVAATVNTHYQLTWVITGRTAGSVTFAFGGYSNVNLSSGNIGIKASATTVASVTPTTDFNGTVTFSIKVVNQSTALTVLKNSTGTIASEIRVGSDVTNITVGKNSGARITTGSRNTGIGDLTFQSLMSGIDNAAFGSNALNSLTDGNQNAAFGRNSGQSLTTGGSNTLIGYAAGGAVTTGGSNTLVGSVAGNLITTGGNNTIIGTSAGNAITTSSGNTMIGTGAGGAVTTTSSASVMGYLALSYATSAGNTVALGKESLRYLADGSTQVTTATNCTHIGTQTRAGSASVSNEVTIGYLAAGLGNDSVVLGNDSITKTALKGNVLIGTTTDGGTDKLQVNGSALFYGSVKMRNVANTFTSSFTNTNTAARTYTLPDATGTVALVSDIPLFITSNVQTGTSYTVVSSDNNKQLIFNNSSAVTVTIPTGLPTGFSCEFYQQGTGKITFVAASGVTLRVASFETLSTYEQYSLVAMENITNMTDTFKFFGQLTSI